MNDRRRIDRRTLPERCEETDRRDTPDRRGIDPNPHGAVYRAEAAAYRRIAGDLARAATRDDPRDDGTLPRVRAWAARQIALTATSAWAEQMARNADSAAERAALRFAEGTD